MNHNNITYYQAKDIVVQKEGFKDWADYAEHIGQRNLKIANDAEKLHLESVFGKLEPEYGENSLYDLYVLLERGFKKKWAIDDNHIKFITNLKIFLLQNDVYEADNIRDKEMEERIKAREIPTK